jgi:hypothetical protein
MASSSSSASNPLPSPSKLTAGSWKQLSAHQTKPGEKSLPLGRSSSSVRGEETETRKRMRQVLTTEEIFFVVLWL